MRSSLFGILFFCLLALAFSPAKARPFHRASPPVEKSEGVFSSLKEKATGGGSTGGTNAPVIPMVVCVAGFILATWKERAKHTASKADDLITKWLVRIVRTAAFIIVIAVLIGKGACSPLGSVMQYITGAWWWWAGVLAVSFASDHYMEATAEWGKLAKYGLLALGWAAWGAVYVFFA